MTTSDRLRELADTLESTNKQCHDGLFFVVPSLATLREMVLVMQEAATELEDWRKAEYEP